MTRGAGEVLPSVEVAVLEGERSMAQMHMKDNSFQDAGVQS